METMTIKIPQHELDQINPWLESDEQVPDAGECEVLKTYTANFSDGIEADIKVCNGDTGAWIDAVLFDYGNEINLLEPRYTLVGEYIFDAGTYGTFTVIIK